MLPTCTKDGTTGDISCKLCGEKLLNGEKLPALGHSPEDLPAVAATCTQDGLTASSACSRCDEVLTVQEVIPALGHTPTTVIDEQDATCTQDGFTAITKCNRCNLLLSEQELIPALGHELAELPAVAATCTQDGLSAGAHCERCDEDVVPQVTVPALGHAYSEWQYHNTQCYDSKERECEVCEKIERQYTQKKDHVQGDNYHCANCGKALITVDSSGYITGCDGALEELTIQDEFNGKRILGIRDYAFAGKNLRDVKIKTQLDYIGAYAFMLCCEDLRIALYTDYYANENVEKWVPEWYYGNGDPDTPFYYYTTKEKQ